MTAQSRPIALRVRGRDLPLGQRTYIMGIINVTPDSFSGDGILAGPGAPVARAVRQALEMVDEGADMLDVGAESTRPGHEPVDEAEERRRVVDVVAAIRETLPSVPISIDTRKAVVAEAAIGAGADIVNDVAGVTAGAALAPVAAAHAVPYIIMHARHRPADGDIVAGVVAELRDALELAQQAGCAADALIVDPGIGFGKTTEQNLALLRGLRNLRQLGRAVLLGASRKSTIGRVLELPVDERLEGTLATTALGIAAGIDIVRVHDVAANVRVARVSDAIVRGGWRDAGERPGARGTRERP